MRLQCNTKLLAEAGNLQQIFAQNTCFLRDTAHENFNWALPNMSFALWEVVRQETWLE
jgi:hypothetical protein